SQHWDRAAFEISERLRARSLLDMLSTHRQLVRNGPAQSLLERQRSLRLQLNFQSAQLERLTRAGAGESELQVRKKSEQTREDMDKVEAQIKAAAQEYANFWESRPASVEDAQAVLDGGTLLLEFCLGEEASYLFLISSDGLHSYRLPPRSDIEKGARR